MGIIENVVRQHSPKFEELSPTFGKLSKDPVWGIPILAVILAVVYFLVVHVANSIALWMQNTLWVPIERLISASVTSPFWGDFLIGEYGVLTLGVSNAILTVLPVLLVFFLLFNTLEDIGYIPNLCALAKRFSEKIGLTGNAILPVTLAFCCKTMATLSTKGLQSSKEKFIAVYLIVFAIPCAAQMALTLSILGSLGLRALFISFSVLASLWVTVGLILNKIIKNDTNSNFIQTLPDIRLQNIKAIVKKTYYKLLWFLEEALPIFVYTAIILFVDDQMGILSSMKTVLKPVIVGFLGFPLKMVDILIICIARHEAAAGLLIKMIRAGDLYYIQSIVGITLTMMFVPCLANIMAMVKELKWKNALLSVICINITAVLVVQV